MKKIAFVLLAAALVFLSTVGLGATINLKATWTAPTTNTDGSQLMTREAGGRAYASRSAACWNGKTTRRGYRRSS